MDHYILSVRKIKISMYVYIYINQLRKVNGKTFCKHILNPFITKFLYYFFNQSGEKKNTLKRIFLELHIFY